MLPPWCNEALEHPQYPLGWCMPLRTASVMCYVMPWLAMLLPPRLLHSPHKRPGPGGDECTPFKGVHPSLETIKRSPEPSGLYVSCACHTANPGFHLSFVTMPTRWWWKISTPRNPQQDPKLSWMHGHHEVTPPVCQELNLAKWVSW